MRNLIASRSLASLRAAASRLSQGRKPFRTDRRGNIAITTALMAVPLMVFGGAALDYSRAQSLRSQLQNAADQAALAAAITDGNKSQRKTYAEKYFNGLLSNSSFASLSVTPDADTDGSGNVTLVKVDSVREIANQPAERDRDEQYPGRGLRDGEARHTQLRRCLHSRRQFPIHGAGGHCAGDNGSDKLRETSRLDAPDAGGGCAFACHLTELWRSRPVYDVARQYGVPLRIDSLRDAIVSVVDEAKAKQGGIKRIPLRRLFVPAKRNANLVPHERSRPSADRVKTASISATFLTTNTVKPASATVSITRMRTQLAFCHF